MAPVSTQATTSSSSSSANAASVAAAAAAGRAEQIAAHLGLASTPQNNTTIANGFITGSTPATEVREAITSDPAAMAALYEPLELEFLAFARHPDHKNAQRLSHFQRREYRSFLSDPTRKPRGQHEHNLKKRAATKFMLVDGQLYRQPGDELDAPDDQAANQPRKVIMLEAAFVTIRRTHEILSHAGMNKTWGEVQRQYYGINKNEVRWVIRNCHLCQQNSSTNIKAPLQMIKSSCPNHRWCIDLFDMRTREYQGMKYGYHSKVSFYLPNLS